MLYRPIGTYMCIGDSQSVVPSAMLYLYKSNGTNAVLPHSRSTQTVVHIWEEGDVIVLLFTSEH